MSATNRIPDGDEPNHNELRTDDEGGLRAARSDWLAESLVVVRLHHSGQAGPAAIHRRPGRDRHRHHAVGLVARHITTNGRDRLARIGARVAMSSGSAQCTRPWSATIRRTSARSASCRFPNERRVNSTRKHCRQESSTASSFRPIVWSWQACRLPRSNISRSARRSRRSDTWSSTSAVRKPSQRESPGGSTSCLSTRRGRWSIPATYWPRSTALILSSRSTTCSTPSEPRTKRTWKARAAGWNCSGSATDQIDEILTSDKANTHLKIRSPISGHVIKKYVREGQYVEEGFATLRHGRLVDRLDSGPGLRRRPGVPADRPGTQIRHERRRPTSGRRHNSRRLPMSRSMARWPSSIRTSTKPRARFQSASSSRIPAISCGRKYGDGFDQSAAQETAHVARIVEGGGMAAEMLEQGRVLAVPETSVIDTGNQTIVYRETTPGVFEGVRSEARTADGRAARRDVVSRTFGIESR